MKRMILCFLMTIGMSISGHSTLADVLITTKTTVRAFGVPTTIDFTFESIKNQWSRTVENDSAAVTGLALPGQRKEKGISVVRLDQDRRWTIFSGDSTYEESSVSSLPDTITPLVSDQQSVDSAFAPKTQSINWQIDSSSHTPDTVLGIPCVVHRSAISAVNGKTEGASDAFFAFWVVPEEDFNREFIDYYRKYEELSGRSIHDWFETYDAFLSMFSISRKDLGLDSLSGVPMKVEISFMADFGPGMKIDTAGQADAFAEDMIAEEVLVDEAANAAVDTTAADPDFNAVDSMADLYKKFFQAASANIRGGALEILGLSAEIIDIDTTALPDSLFELPMGYTKQ